DGIQWTDRGTVLANIGDNTVASPSVVLDSAVYRMWFNMTSPTKKSIIGFATSSDGISWSVSQDADMQPVAVFSAGESGRWDRPGVGQPMVILDPNSNLFKMWYIGGA